MNLDPKNCRLLRISNIISCVDHLVKSCTLDNISDNDAKELETRIYILQRQVAEECDLLMIDKLLGLSKGGKKIA